MSVHSGLHVYEHDKPPPYSPIYTITYTENTRSSHEVSQFVTIDLIHAADWKHPQFSLLYISVMFNTLFSL